MVNLESFLLINNGLMIETREGMGRVAVSTRTFDTLYEIVIREKPSLVWESDNILKYIKKFMTADETTKTAILDMYHPPLSAPSVVGLKGMAHRIAAGDANFIHKLLAIWITNAHQYYGEKVVAEGGDLRQYEQMRGDAAAGVPTKLTALFVYGSKIAHSCAPNLTYSSQTDDGALEYKVIRPIGQGEVVTFSYIAGLYNTPTDKRREKLMQSKSFYCECSRCMGPDYCRYVQCTGCQQSYVPCIYDEHRKPTWTCMVCGIRDDIGPKEKHVVDRLKSLEVRSADDDLKPLQDLVKDAANMLSPVHYVTIKALEIVAQLSASKAASQEMMVNFMGMMMKRGPPRQEQNYYYGVSNTEELRLIALPRQGSRLLWLVNVLLPHVQVVMMTFGHYPTPRIASPMIPCMNWVQRYFMHVWI